jgi:AraC family transcriptional regulator of adaptative response/methylated-DNA-[protein]-cysteine methyltransferase
MTAAALDQHTDPRWAQLKARDAAADGSFVYGVTTTGVYCRPSCPSRAAKPQNVRFFAANAEAEAAGFRACLRCKPTGDSRAQETAVKVAAAAKLIDEAETPPVLDGLAEAVGLSPFHFHRVFKAATGLTPRQYAHAKRGAKVRAALKTPTTVTQAIYEAGFNANSRFYEQSDALLGMTPSAYKDGGAKAQIRFAIGQSSLGAILVASSDKGVCSILIGDDPQALAEDLQRRFGKATLVGDDPQFATLVALVVGFVEAPKLGLDLPLDVRGTAFQQRVWQALRAIPAGSTASYADIAAAIGSPKAVRAVAGACAANPIAVAIPCHRVLRNDGALSGYRWGVERKRALLDAET